MKTSLTVKESLTKFISTRLFYGLVMGALGWGGYLLSPGQFSILGTFLVSLYAIYVGGNTYSKVKGVTPPPEA